MRVSDFHFDLPDELIARYPKEDRSSCRLLQLNGENGEISHRTFTDVLDLIDEGDLLIFNNTRVIPARMFGRKASGGKIEVLVERVLSEHHFLAHIRSSKAPKEGAELFLGEDKLGQNKGVKAIMVGRQDALFEVELADKSRNVLDVLQEIGHMPLPPYIDRPDEEADQECYQTVYNKVPGAVAAPTGGVGFGVLGGSEPPVRYRHGVCASFGAADERLGGVCVCAGVACYCVVGYGSCGCVHCHGDGVARYPFGADSAVAFARLPVLWLCGSGAADPADFGLYCSVFEPAGA